MKKSLAPSFSTARLSFASQSISSMLTACSIKPIGGGCKRSVIEDFRLLRGGKRQGKQEGGALPRSALDSDSSLVALNNGSNNVQPQSQSDPFATLDLDPHDPVKAFPDPLLFFRR